MSQKTPKIAALTAIGLTGWMLPLATPLPLPLEGFSLAMGLFSSAALSAELKRETIVSGVKSAERKLSLERVAYQMSLEHEAELQRLRGMYGIGLDHDDYEDEDDREYKDRPHPQLDGATIHQTALPGGGGADLWNLDLLLKSNSSHLLLIGQTGSGKTTLARYLIDQLHPDKTIVLDADDDGQTWKPLTAIGTGDDWEAIDEAMNQGLTCTGE
jgi:ABC-type multidrug transport system fused ATPase/permease subunit